MQACMIFVSLCMALPLRRWYGKGLFKDTHCMVSVGGSQRDTHSGVLTPPRTELLS